MSQVETCPKGPAPEGVIAVEQPAPAPIATPREEYPGRPLLVVPDLIARDGDGTLKVRVIETAARSFSEPDVGTSLVLLRHVIDGLYGMGDDPGMDANRLSSLQGDLAAFLTRLTPDLGRSERRRWATAYLRGLLLDGDRKSAGAMAERLAAVDRPDRDYEQGLQQFLSQSPWDDRPVRDQLTRWAVGHIGDGDRHLIIDDTGFPKQGKHSVAVARQYSGTLGKVGNCQLAVTLQMAGPDRVVCLDAELYLPREWAGDRDRCRAAGVPDDVACRPKWELALAMLGRAKLNGATGVVLADSDYGGNAKFRDGLEAGGWRYAVAVDRNTAVIDAAEDLGPVPEWKGRGPRPTRPERVRSGEARAVGVDAWAVARAADFARVAWREGSRGEMAGRFAAWRVRPAPDLSARVTPGAACWLLAEWPKGEEAPSKFYFSNLPEDTPLKSLVGSVKGRWRVEQGYQQMKEELGLDHFEGRSWRGWHHHVTLVMVAFAFLVSLRTGGGEKGGRRDQPRQPSRRSAG